MQKRPLGNTGIEITIAGLGCGGNSKLGLSYGATLEQASQVVSSAVVDGGVNLIDTARIYGTEEAVGKGIAGLDRSGLVITSKSSYLDNEGKLLTAAAFMDNLETSLRLTGSDYLDVYFIHGLSAKYYNRVRDLLLPVLQKARSAGKIRSFGITEAFESDPGHAMLNLAVQDREWQVFMVGYNLINQSAARTLLPQMKANGCGTLGMFAVRRGLIDERRLRLVLAELVRKHQIAPEVAEAGDFLELFGVKGEAISLTETAYRFVAYAQGMDGVLLGTGNSAHFQQNLADIRKGALSRGAVDRLHSLFAEVDSVSGQTE